MTAWTPEEWLRWGSYLALDGLFVVACLLVAGLLLRRSRTASLMVAIVAALRAGEMGMGFATSLAMQPLIDWMSNNAYYDWFDLLFAAENLMFGIMSAAQWVLLGATVYVGRTPPSNDAG